MGVSKLAALILALAISCAPVLAQEGSAGTVDVPRAALPGIGRSDGRVRVDPNQRPWRAIGKLQANSANYHVSCTGALIGEAQVLTAAHCLINPVTRQYFTPSSLHFLIGYDHGAYAGHPRGLSLSVAPGYDPTHPVESGDKDWAVLTIDQPLGVPDRILKLSDAIPADGTRVMIGGYAQDHAIVLTADMACRITQSAVDQNGLHLFHHNCAVTHGVSGAPLLIKAEAGWRIAGVNVAGAVGARGGVAVGVDGLKLDR